MPERSGLHYILHLRVVSATAMVQESCLCQSHGSDGTGAQGAAAEICLEMGRLLRHQSFVPAPKCSTASAKRPAPIQINQESNVVLFHFNAMGSRHVFWLLVGTPGTKAAGIPLQR